MHGNVDGLSRCPCLEAKCKYCSRMEVQSANALREEEIVGHLILERNSSEE